MKTRMFIEQPDEVEVTLKVTMKVKDWCALRDQLNGAWPSWKLSGAITEMLAEVRKIFYPKEPTIKAASEASPHGGTNG